MNALCDRAAVVRPRASCVRAMLRGPFLRPSTRAAQIPDDVPAFETAELLREAREKVDPEHDRSRVSRETRRDKLHHFGLTARCAPCGSLRGRSLRAKLLPGVLSVTAGSVDVISFQFQRSADAGNNLTALKKISTWEQATFVEKGGWAVMPGGNAVDSGVPQACAAMLSNLK